MARRTRGTYQLDQLRQPEPELYQHGVGVVADGPDEPIVVAEQVVVQPFGVRVAQATGRGQEQQDERLIRRSRAAATAEPDCALAALAAVVAAVSVIVDDGPRHRVERSISVIRSRRRQQLSCQPLAGSRMLCALTGTATGAPQGLRRKAHWPAAAHAPIYTASARTLLRRDAPRTIRG